MSARRRRVPAFAIAAAVALAIAAGVLLLRSAGEPPLATGEIGEESREALRQVIREESGR